MRAASIAITALALASTAAVAAASGAASPAKTTGTPACAASLQKMDGPSGYKIVRKCASGVAIAQGPIVNGLGQGEGANGGSVVLSLFSIGMIGAGIYYAFQEDNRVLPNDSDGGLNPVSP